VRPFLSKDELSPIATGRSVPLFAADLDAREDEIRERLRGERILVIGGAGSIGAATVGELSLFDVAALHVVDLNENGLAELVRDLRSRPAGLSVSDFRTLPLDFGSETMRRFIEDQPPYAFVLNFAAVKHVRSEKDSYSLLHMLDTNVLKPSRLLAWLMSRGSTDTYFCVSTDKAANPVNLMGATKRLMEHVIFGDLHGAGDDVRISSARFANVAFSDGSLLEGWLRRLEKRQPLSVPRDTRRYFMSLREAGQLCLVAAACAPSGHLVIPRLDAKEHLRDLEGIARALLERVGYEPAIFEHETLARTRMAAETDRARYPLLITPLDTSGEKPFEEFVGEGETTVELGLPNLLGVRHRRCDSETLHSFLAWLERTVSGEGKTPSKADIVAAIGEVVVELRHFETEKQLDHRM
jgi:FlaA1/EpsC-like NDP-sugar epimerase